MVILLQGLIVFASRSVSPKMHRHYIVTRAASICLQAFSNSYIPVNVTLQSHKYLVAGDNVIVSRSLEEEMVVREYFLVNPCLMSCFCNDATS
jgi:hypothetical protein